MEHTEHTQSSNFQHTHQLCRAHKDDKQPPLLAEVFVAAQLNIAIT